MVCLLTPNTEPPDRKEWKFSALGVWWLCVHIPQHRDPQMEKE